MAFSLQVLCTPCSTLLQIEAPGLNWTISMWLQNLDFVRMVHQHWIGFHILGHLESHLKSLHTPRRVYYFWHELFVCLYALKMISVRADKKLSNVLAELVSSASTIYWGCCISRMVLGRKTKLSLCLIWILSFRWYWCEWHELLGGTRIGLWIRVCSRLTWFFLPNPKDTFGLMESLWIWNRIKTGIE